MSEPRAREAAETIWASWEGGQRLQELPDSCRPRSLQEGYAAQAMLEEVAGGVCGVPSPIGKGDHVWADFGPLGRVALTLDA